MITKSKKTITSVTLMPQIYLLLSQVLFLAVLVSIFSLLGASFIAYDRALSLPNGEGAVSFLYN
tara:strand:+ start:47 stop:238 length:192 start_codon:yes stop_codon:yes gene_type:complete